MLEVEMKFAVADLPALERRLRELGAVPHGSRTDEDRYFNAPDRDFARTDEALRIRSIGSSNFITYKGPKRDPQTKTRTELELPLPSGDEARAGYATLLAHLGYRAVAVVRKSRNTWHCQRDGFTIEICLDQVDELGSFAELEIQADE